MTEIDWHNLNAPAKKKFQLMCGCCTQKHTPTHKQLKSAKRDLHFHHLFNFVGHKQYNLLVWCVINIPNIVP